MSARKPGSRAFVTGSTGFVGPYLVAALGAAGFEVTAPPRVELDLCDAQSVRSAIAGAQPDTIFHLAAFSSPQRSWEAPREALLTNLEMALNVLEAVRLDSPGTAVALAGSGQVYGQAETLPVTEDQPFAPNNPYAVSKAAVDLLGAQYADSGLRVTRLRPFNHVGPGQTPEYVLSSMAHQIAVAELNDADEAVVRTGDAEASRDFTDVRDMALAYVAAIDAEPGAYNVCSGVATRIADLVQLFEPATSLPIRHEMDHTRLRTHDLREMRGSAARLHAATGWAPTIELEQTAADTLAWWRERLAA